MKWFYLLQFVCLFGVVVCGIAIRKNDFHSVSKVKPGRLVTSKLQDDTSGCQCVTNNCGCCFDLDISQIHLQTTGCVNVTYLPDQYGISFTVSLGNKVYINETISVKNPPPICAGIPDFEKEASICIDFYNLDYSQSHLTGCIKLEARLLHVKIEDVDLGCFNIPVSWQQQMKAKYRGLKDLIGRKMRFVQAGLHVKAIDRL